MNITLREDQKELKNAIYQDWRNGATAVLGVLSTGGGKSVIASDVTNDGVREGKQQVIIAHRNELVSQMSGHVADRGIQHRIIGSDATVRLITHQHREKYGRSFVNPSAPTAVVGVDTMISRYSILKDWLLKTDRWKIDEAHHVLKTNKWGKAVDMMNRAQGLGLTATPQRADGQGLGRSHDGVFDTMQIGINMRSLIGIGALSDYEIVCPTSDLHVDEKDLSANGDWSNQKLRIAAKKSKIVGDVVGAYCQYAFGRKAICFATDIETAGEIANKFNASGIPAASLSSETPFVVRDKYIKEFKSGKIWVLINVDLFDEGFDVPSCDVVIMARPTASLGKYRQMVGRALRFIIGKVALIIDHVSNVLRHGLPDKYIDWTLSRRDKRGKQEPDPDEIPLTVCKFCTKPYEKWHLLCPYCGKAPPLPEPRSRTIEMVEGDLILLDRERLEAMRAATQIEAPGSVGQRVSGAVGHNAGVGAATRQMEKIAAQEHLKTVIAQWAAIERVNGRSDREIHRRFYLTIGTDVLTVLDGSRSRVEYEETAAKIEKWIYK